MFRNFNIGDWKALHHMIRQYQASEYAAYDHQWPTSEDEIKKVTKWFASNDNYWAVCLKETGQIVGLVSLNAEPDDSQALNLGYIFDFDYHGNGFAAEACRAAISDAFDRPQVQKVVTGTAAANEPSCRLLERLGFTRKAERIGSLTTSNDNPIEFLGCTYEISRDEWEAANRQATT